VAIQQLGPGGGWLGKPNPQKGKEVKLCKVEVGNTIYEYGEGSTLTVASPRAKRTLQVQRREMGESG
jgi:hypothetical protein